MEKSVLRNQIKNRKPCVMLAEDDKEMRNVLITYLKKFGYSIIICKDGQELIDKLREHISGREFYKKIDLIISDVRMPHISGFEILKSISPFKKYPPMILITAFGSEELHKKAKDLGALAVFDKPFDLDDLILFLEDVFPSCYKDENYKIGDRTYE